MALNNLFLYSAKLFLIVICVGIVTPVDAQWAVDDDGCRTPDGGVGSCIKITECKSVQDFIENYSPLSQFAKDKLQGYHCGVIKNSLKVCCPKSPIVIETANIEESTTTDQPPDDECTTPEQDVGSCLPIKECKPIMDFIQKFSPLSQHAIKTLQGYQCGVGNSLKMCCPKNSISIETVKNQTDTLTEPPLDDECITPDKAVGSCVPLRECKPITDFMQNSSPLSQYAIEALQGYQCGLIGNSVKMCCPKGPIELLNIRAPTITEQPPDVTNHRNLNLLPYECGLQFSESRITGGNKTVLFEFPWMALLSYETGKSRDFRCGGTIINERYILTAAHCITNLSSLKLIGVRVGEYNISSLIDCEKHPLADEYCAPPVQDIVVAEAIPHPNYNATSITNDIGLIRLVSPIDLSVDNARPICLPVTNAVRNKSFKNASLTVTGWGITETGRRSADLLKVDVPVTTEETCRKAYEKASLAINHKQICAGGQNSGDSCGGDSGGPLQTSLPYNNDVRCVQFGIVSFGPRVCGQDGFPAVYTRVDYYMDWILDNIRP